MTTRIDPPAFVGEDFATACEAAAAWVESQAAAGCRVVATHTEQRREAGRTIVRLLSRGSDSLLIEGLNHDS